MQDAEVRPPPRFCAAGEPMNARVVLLAGMLALTAVAFSGVLAEHTGVEIAAPAAAECLMIDDTCYPGPSCIVAALLREVTGEDWPCTM
jgi:hypothetical protein